jgi:hypothetical protein
MLQLRCTAKVIRELGLRSGQLAMPAQGESKLGNWYLNLFTVDRRKTFVFVNERTLLSFIVFGVKKSNIDKTPEIFLNGLDHLLVLESLEPGEINRVFQGYESLEFTKTNSRKVLGNMNDLVDMYRYHILYEGGFRAADIGSIIMRVNRTPQRNLGWSSSIDMVRGLLQETSQ